MKIRMVLFRDAEIYAISLEEITKKDCMLFFLDGHTSDVISVLDSEGKFVGILDYNMTLYGGDDVTESIQRECVHTWGGI